MQSLSENKLLCYGLCASYALVFLAATEQLPWLNETMQLVPMPTASVTRWGWRRACAILELTLAFHVLLPSFLPQLRWSVMGLMAVDTVAVVAWEFCVRTVGRLCCSRRQS